MDKRERARRDYEATKYGKRERERQRDKTQEENQWKERKKENLHTYIHIFTFSLPLFVPSRSLSIDCELVSNPKASSVPSFLGDAADKETSSTLYQVGGNGRREVTRSGTPVRCSPPSSSSIHLVLPFPPPPIPLHSPSSSSSTIPSVHPFPPVHPPPSFHHHGVDSFRLTFPCPAVGGRTTTTRPPTWREIRHVVLMAFPLSILPNKELPERVQRAPASTTTTTTTCARTCVRVPTLPFCVRAAGLPKRVDNGRARGFEGKLVQTVISALFAVIDSAGRAAVMASL